MRTTFGNTKTCPDQFDHKLAGWIGFYRPLLQFIRSRSSSELDPPHRVKFEFRDLCPILSSCVIHNVYWKTWDVKCKENRKSITFVAVSNFKVFPLWRGCDGVVNHQWQIDALHTSTYTTVIMWVSELLISINTLHGKGLQVKPL